MKINVVNSEIQLQYFFLKLIVQFLVKMDCLNENMGDDYPYMGPPRISRFEKSSLGLTELGLKKIFRSLSNSSISFESEY